MFNTEKVRSIRTPNKIKLKEKYAVLFLYNRYGVVIAKARIDLEDVKRVEKHKWCLSAGSRAYSHSAGKLHRFIMDAKDYEEYDHINRKPLDNRKKNLRLCTRKGNSGNVTKQKNNTTGAKGVTWDKCRNKYKAQITVSKAGKRKSIYLGLFEDVVEAARAYNKAAREHFGEFACCNNIKELKRYIATT